MFQAKLPDGTLIDDTYPRGYPLIIRLGGGQIIKGLEIGLVGMCIGEVRYITIPPSKAYGTTGIPPLIPPNALIFVKIEMVEIVKVTDQSKPNLQSVPKEKDSNFKIKSSDSTNKQYESVRDGINQKELPHDWGVDSNAEPHPHNGGVTSRTSKNFKVQSGHEKQYWSKNSEGTYDHGKQTEADIESEIRINSEDDKTYYNYDYHNNEL